MRHLLVVLPFIWSCGVTRQPSLCQMEGKVIQMDGLDGCQWLIQTKDGQKLLPQNAAEFALTDGQSVYFNYRVFDGMSICMAEDLIVTLTCLEIRKVTECSDGGWEQIEWLRHLIEDEGVRKIDQFRAKDQLWYHITFQPDAYAWYNCHGQKICLSDQGCMLDEKLLRDQVTIFLAQR